MDVTDLPPLTLLAIPGFVAAMIAEIAIGWWTRRVRYETRDTLASLCMGAGNVLEGLVAGFVAATVYAACYRLAPFEIPFSIATIALCFVLDDLRYYWFHRLSHEHRWLWAAHVNHHSSQHYNLSTALRQTWTGTVALSFVFRIPLLLLGFHPVMLAFVGSMNLIYQFWIHTEAIGTLPRPIEAIFNTPSHHRVHHARNPRYLDANYAGTFIVWDRLFGTFVPEDDREPCRYGLVANIGSFNPIRIALHEWAGIVRDALRAGLTLRERLRYVFGAPGYSHDGSRRTTAAIKARYIELHPEQRDLPGLR